MSKQSRYWKSSHTKHRMIFHIVWIPKYRKRVLEGEVARRIEELVRECVDFTYTLIMKGIHVLQ